MHGNNNDFEENAGAQKQRVSTASTSLRRMMAINSIQENTKALSLQQAAKAINEQDCTSCDRIEEMGASHEEKALVSSARSGSGGGTKSSTQSEHVVIVDKASPLPFMAAMVVDSFMDGFLIGITGAAGPLLECPNKFCRLDVSHGLSRPVT